MSDRFEGIRRRLEEAVLAGPGETPAELRAAVASSKSVPEELRALVEKIHQHAYRVTDEEVAALQTRYSDDYLFEVLAAAAVGAARMRLEKALAVLDEGEADAAAQA
jgi:hypothetical protein